MCMMSENAKIKPIHVVRGDTHGEEGVFIHLIDEHLDVLEKDDKLFICGDFGYVWDDGFRERKFLEYMANELKFTILFVDGNHENHRLLGDYPEEEWCGGKIHVIGRDKAGTPKIIHLMRGQVYEIDGKTFFTFGGGYSRDKWMRQEGVSWWPEEMPTDDEMVAAIKNLEKHNNTVDYILSHTAPEYIMMLSYPEHREEQPLNNFLQWVKENVSYKHWFFGHLHLERDYLDNISCCMHRLRYIDDNNFVGEDDCE